MRTFDFKENFGYFLIKDGKIQINHFDTNINWLAIYRLERTIRRL